MIASWKKLGVEVLISMSEGEFWLVPEYTGGKRAEMTPEDFSKCMEILKEFPGATVQTVRKLTHGKVDKPAAKTLARKSSDDHPF